MKQIAAILMLCASQAIAQQPDAQQAVAQLQVIVAHQSREIDARTLRIAILTQQIEAMQKQIEDAKPKGEKK